MIYYRIFLLIIVLSLPAALTTQNMQQENRSYTRLHAALSAQDLVTGADEYRSSGISPEEFLACEKFKPYRVHMIEALWRAKEREQLIQLRDAYRNHTQVEPELNTIVQYANACLVFDNTDFNKSEEMFKAIFPEVKSSSNRFFEICVRLRLAYYQFQINLDAAVQQFREAYLIALQEGKTRNTAFAAYYYAEALSRNAMLNKALVLVLEWERIAKPKDWWYEAARFSSVLGQLYSDVGTSEEALHYYQEAVTYSNKSNQPTLRVYALLGMQSCYIDLQRSYEAQYEVLMEADSLVQAHELRNLYWNVSVSLVDLLSFMKRFSDAEQRLDHLRQYAKNDDRYQRGLASVAATLYWNRGDYSTAAMYDVQSLKHAKRSGSPTDLIKAYDRVGMDYLDLMEPRAAIPYFREAANIHEELLQQFTLSPNLKRGLLSNAYEYNSLVACYSSIGMPDSAHYFSELGKGRTALDTYTSTILHDGQVLPALLRSKFERLQNKIESLESKPGDGHEQELTSLVAQRNILIDSARRLYPRIGQMLLPVILPIEELQRDVLRPFELIVSFSVDDEFTSVIAISRDTSVCSTVPIGDWRLARLVRSIWEEDSSKLKMPGYNVYQAKMLFDTLFTAIKPLLRRHRDLIIVPDASLYSVPFEALPTDITRCKDSTDVRNARFLIDDHDIGYAVSASLYARDMKRANERRYAAKGLLAFGNPSISGKTKGSYRSITSVEGLEEPRALSLSNLRYAEDEVRRISDSLAASESSVLLRRAATEGRFFREAGNYQLLHFASHNLVNEDNPAKSMLFLASDGSQDGLVLAEDIARMRLHADLVVLSACESGAGRFFRGDGIASMGRAFWIAGVPSIVMSLWNIDDKASAEFMATFYSLLSKGYSKREAISETKRIMRRNGYHNPYYWSAFVL
ncbi:MAG: hypothetical protein CL946_09860, partial [Ectothiorhodospiraceae bacterium]|nr:hypothetical protein [Ectothiorhodospiraceae bacterium]